MKLDPDKLAHKLSELGHDWADKDAAFYALDETKKDVLANCKAMVPDPDGKLSDVAKEAQARLMPEWREHQKALAAARRAMNNARVSYNTCQAYCELIRSREATARAEMNLT